MAWGNSMSFESSLSQSKLKKKWKSCYVQIKKKNSYLIFFTSLSSLNKPSRFQMVKWSNCNKINHKAEAIVWRKIRTNIISYSRWMMAGRGLDLL